MSRELVAMPFSELLSEIKSKDIGIYFEQGRLRCQAPLEILTPELRTALRTHKSELIDLLSRKEPQQAPRLEPVSREKSLPLSFAQQRLWFLEQLDPGTSAYNMVSALRLTGQLDIEALNRSFNEVIRRHETLRSTFDTIDGKPIQVIHSSTELPLHVVDLQDWAEAEREEELTRLLDLEAAKPFDLTKGPLLRTTLLHLGEQTQQSEYVLVLTMHHIISDDWSVAILFREIALSYDAFRKGHPFPLAPLWIQYADFACWQRQWLQGDVLERLLAYWTNKLAGSPPPLGLPVIQSAQALPNEADVYDFSWPRLLLERLNELSLQNDITLFMTLLAAFMVLLHRYMGQSDINVGTPIANRNRLDVESIVGFFVNTLVLRIDLSGNPSFAELLKRVKETAFGAQAHQDLPFDKLVEELHPVRDPSHSPFFQIMFVLHNVYFEEPEIPGIQTSLVTGIKKGTPFDMTLHFAESGNGLRGWFEFKACLFDRAFVQQVERHLKVISENIVIDPQCRLSNLPLLTDPERHRLLVEWNATEVDYPGDECLHQLFEVQVEKTPEAIAVVHEDRQLSYRELNARANRIGHYLQALGVGPESLVGLCVQRSLELVVGILGILKAGGAYEPIDPNYPEERIAFMVEDAALSLVLTHRATLPTIIEVVPDGMVVVNLESEWEKIARCSDYTLPCQVVPENLAYVIYTSGSTGKPKGVAVTHGNVLASTRARLSYYEEPIERFLLLSSFAFDSSVAGIFWTLCQGGSLRLPDDETHLVPEGLVELIGREAVTHLLCLPSLYRLILECGGKRLTTLRTIVVAGEACWSDLIGRHYQALPQVSLFNEYGPTEGTVWSSVYRFQPEDAQTTVPIGRPISNIRIYLMDAHLNPVPIGVPGELYIGGAGLARGYLNRPALTAARFIPNPFGEPGSKLYRTGDLARYRPDGNIEYLGRSDHQVKIRGYRIEPAEIEATLARHPKVKQAVVIAREDTPGNKRLVGYVAGNEPEPTVEELGTILKETLPNYMVPSAFVFLEALPLTPNDKVDRKALPEPDAGSQSAHRYVAPRTPTEEILSGIWAEILGVERVGIHDNFFEVGGHSLLLMQLLSKIQATFNGKLSLRNLLERPTVAGLAGLIEGGEERETGGRRLSTSSRKRFLIPSSDLHRA
ncbi:MAG: amino acid adenylation domain-containing protein [Methylococcales bacterium]